MQKKTILLACLLYLAAFTAGQFAIAAEPTPAPGCVFSLPMTDGTQSQAVILSSGSGTSWLVWATPSGKLGFWTLIQTAGTAPQPEPPPLPPPAGPLVLITITPEQPAAIGGEVKTWLATHAGTFFAYTTAQVASDNLDSVALKWIGLSAGKNYPYSFLATAAGEIVWEGPTPSSDARILRLLNQYSPAATKKARAGK